jgi:hypothetical protein
MLKGMRPLHPSIGLAHERFVRNLAFLTLSFITDQIAIRSGEDAEDQEAPSPRSPLHARTEFVIENRDANMELHLPSNRCRVTKMVCAV